MSPLSAVASEPEPEGTPLYAAPISAYSPQDQAFYKWWYSHMKDDLMQQPLDDVKHSTARYIWDASLRATGAQEP